MNKRTLGPDGPEVSDDRPRLHGHVGLLRHRRRGRGAGHDRARARARLQLPRHLRHVRAAHQRGLVGSAIAARRDEVFLATKFGIKLIRARRSAQSRRRRQPRLRARGLRRLARTPRRRSHRPLLPAPRRPQHPDRGDRRRDGRARRRRQGPLPRPLRGQRRRRSAAHTRCTRSPPCRASTRCGPATWRPRSCPRSRSSASRSSPTRRSAAASSPGASAPPRSSRRATSAATAPASPARTSQQNLELAARVRELAAEQGITPGQLALAWVLHRGEHIVPIPGTKRVSYLEENLAAAEVQLSDEEVERIAEAVPRQPASATPRPHALGQPLAFDQ